MHDLYGNMVFRSVDKVLDFRFLSRGVYLLRLVSVSGERLTLRVVKE